MSAPGYRFTATDVPSKTAAGRRELVDRACGLSALERALLVMADGRQDFAALLAALDHDGRQDATVAACMRLVALGLLDARGNSPAASRRSLALARLYLIESMERALRGRTADLVPQLRAATDEASLLSALMSCERRLNEIGAESQAAAIRARCLELLPEPALSPTAQRAATDR